MVGSRKAGKGTKAIVVYAYHDACNGFGIPMCEFGAVSDGLERVVEFPVYDGGRR